MILGRTKERLPSFFPLSRHETAPWPWKGDRIALIISSSDYLIVLFMNSKLDLYLHTIVTLQINRALQLAEETSASGFYVYFVLLSKEESWHTGSKTPLYTYLYMWIKFFKKMYALYWLENGILYWYQRSHSNARTQETEPNLRCVNLIWSFPDSCLADANPFTFS